MIKTFNTGNSRTLIEMSAVEVLEPITLMSSEELALRYKPEPLEALKLSIEKWKRIVRWLEINGIRGVENMSYRDTCALCKYYYIQKKSLSSCGACPLKHCHYEDSLFGQIYAALRKGSPHVAIIAANRLRDRLIELKKEQEERGKLTKSEDEKVRIPITLPPGVIMNDEEVTQEIKRLEREVIDIWKEIAKWKNES